jgi:hypothetical protein
MELLSVSWKNMEITVFGIKLRLGVIILIVVLYWLLWGHVLCSCSRVGLLEGLDTIAGAVGETVTQDGSSDDKKCKDENGDPALNADGTPVCKPDMPSLSGMEGFVGANTNYGESSKYSLTNYKPIKTSSWFTPNLTYKKGGKEGKGVQNILNREKQPVPLPEGQLLMFANTPFKPECCPNAYSNSMGCACMTVDQYNYLIDRGGNNVPYSEY